MIVSHRYGYLFVELPHTACTAISKELCDLYDGEPIFRKHAYYHTFLRVATAEERSYFVFSSIRNPADEAVSIYFKYRTDHMSFYTNKKHLRRYGGHVTEADLKRFRFISETNAEFPAYFKRFYQLPYDNWSSLAHHKFDYVIRFERVQEGFSRILELLGVEQKRAIPAANVTAKPERDFWAYYSLEIREHAKWIFGPFMKKWGYEFPTEWGNDPVPLSSQVLFDTLAVYRSLRWRYLKSGSSLLAKSLDGLLERLSLQRHRHL
jgi:hypothetical protein